MAKSAGGWLCPPTFFSRKSGAARFSPHATVSSYVRRDLISYYAKAAGAPTKGYENEYSNPRPPGGDHRCTSRCLGGGPVR